MPLHKGIYVDGQRSTRVVADREQQLREGIEGILSHSRKHPKVVYKALRIGYSTLVYSLHSEIVPILSPQQYHPSYIPI